MSLWKSNVGRCTHSTPAQATTNSHNVLIVFPGSSQENAAIKPQRESDPRQVNSIIDKCENLKQCFYSRTNRLCPTVRSPTIGIEGPCQVLSSPNWVGPLKQYDR